MNTNKALKTLLITSTLPGEGKSWTAANLAVTFAQAGKKVLLIDADMRKGRQFKIFDVAPTPGLSNYLSGIIDGESGDYDLKDFIDETEVEGLYILPAGNVPPNPSELLVSEKMIDLIKKVSKEYDITIFDGTPGLLVADAAILSRLVDSTIIVTAYNETKIDNVSEVKKAIENIGGKVAGVVINKIPISSKKYENTYYYGHKASSDFKKPKRKKEDLYKEELEEEAENKFKEIKKELKKVQTKQVQTKKKKDEEDDDEGYVWPKLSWEKEAESAYENIKAQDNEEKNSHEESKDTENTENTEYTLDKTQDVLNQINKYLDAEKNKLKNGGKDD